MKKKLKPTKKEKMWAVEQAVKWPINYYSGGSGFGANQTFTVGANYGHYDADVIGRAKKLLDFLND